MDIKIDRAGAEYAIKKGREEAPKRRAAERWREDHFPGGFYSAKELSASDKLSILSKHYGEIWSNWYQLWTEIRGRIWTRSGLH